MHKTEVLIADANRCPHAYKYNSMIAVGVHDALFICYIECLTSTTKVPVGTRILL